MCKQQRKMLVNLLTINAKIWVKSQELNVESLFFELQIKNKIQPVKYLIIDLILLKLSCFLFILYFFRFYYSTVTFDFFLTMCY